MVVLTTAGTAMIVRPFLRAVTPGTVAVYAAPSVEAAAAMGMPTPADAALESSAAFVTLLRSWVAAPVCAAVTPCGLEVAAAWPESLARSSVRHALTPCQNQLKNAAGGL